MTRGNAPRLTRTHTFTLSSVSAVRFGQEADRRGNLNFHDERSPNPQSLHTGSSPLWRVRGRPFQFEREIDGVTAERGPKTSENHSS